MNRHIPQSVENIILRSMRKNPSERYASAAEMLKDLESCLSTDRVDEDKLEFDADMEVTRVMPAIRGGDMYASEPAYDRERERPGYDNAQASVDRRQEGGPPRRKRWVKPVIIFGGTLLVLVLLFWGLRVFLSDLETDEVHVPYVVGKSEAEAIADLKAAGLLPEDPIIYEARPDIPKDQVFQQSKQNMMVKTGSYVRLYVSTGPVLEEMLDYVGQQYADAKTSLQNMGLTDDQILKEEVFSEQAAGTIISQTPTKGDQFQVGQVTVKFQVSKGLETLEMPNLVGLTQKEAIKKISDNKLKLGPGNGIVQEPSYRPAGEVLEQFPHEAGTGAYGHGNYDYGQLGTSG